MLLVIALINTFLLIVVIITLGKMVGFDADKKDDQTSPPQSLVDLPKTQSYDMNVFSGKADPYTDGVERRLLPMKNWDGVSPQNQE